MKHRNTKPNVERRTLGYIRVSTEDQAISLDAQEAESARMLLQWIGPYPRSSATPDAAARTCSGQE